MSEQKTNLYAVYGSLREGFGNHPVLGDSKLLGECITPPEFSMYSIRGSFPGVIKGGKTPITLEIYEVLDSNIERNLDMLEGYRGPDYHNLYDKEEIETPYGTAFIYYFARDNEGYEEVKSGDWKEFKLNK